VALIGFERKAERVALFNFFTGAVSSAPNVEWRLYDVTNAPEVHIFTYTGMNIANSVYTVVPYANRPLN